MNARRSRRAKGATTTTAGGALTRWLASHRHSLRTALGAFRQGPLAAALTCAVIGVALALPAGLYVLLDNVRELSAGWESPARITLFLRTAVSDERAAELAETLVARADIEGVQVKPRREALEEYQTLSGIDDLATALGEQNPLPAVIVVDPGATLTQAESARTLAAKLASLDAVESAQLDIEWLERLAAFVALLRRGLLALAVLLGLGVALIVGNTIRSNVAQRHEEVEISKLLGATNGFIRRPFLYGGALYGLLGGIIAALIVWAGLAVLTPPVRTLINLYGGKFQIAGMTPSLLGWVLLSGAMLGVLGAWVSVERHLHRETAR